MQDQQQVQGVDDDRIRLVLPGRHREHHAQEIGAVGERVVGIDERLADGFLVREGCQGPDLGDQAGGVQVEIFDPVGR